MVRYETTTVRSVCAVIAGLSSALLLAHLRTQAAFAALGFEEWRDLYLLHLQTIAGDFGACFVVALLVWVVCHWVGVREAKYAVVLGSTSFIVVPTVLGALFLSQYGYPLPDLLALMFRHYWIAVLAGGVLGLVMWRIAYRRRKAEDKVAVFA